MKTLFCISVVAATLNANIIPNGHDTLPNVVLKNSVIYWHNTENSRGE